MVSNFTFWTMHFLKVNEKPTNALTIKYIGTQCFPTCFGTLKCHHQGVKHDPATPPVTIYSSRPSLLPTTLDTYLSRIMFDSLMMAFQSAETSRRILGTNTLNDYCV
jgi:hypothetical protein